MIERKEAVVRAHVARAEKAEAEAAAVQLEMDMLRQSLADVESERQKEVGRNERLLQVTGFHCHCHHCLVLHRHRHLTTSTSPCFRRRARRRSSR